MDTRLATIGIMCFLFAGMAWSPEFARGEGRPNILLVLADNWRWPNAGVLGDPHARTPAFDRVVREGMLFRHTFNPVPSCSPTRACLLTGKVAHQLGERASLWSAFPKDTPVITDMLREAGYEVGFSGKGWGPGEFERFGWQENPVGKKYRSFEEFVSHRNRKAPFFFWIGNTDTATKGGKHPFLEDGEKIVGSSRLPVPPELPDCGELRKDLLHYYGGIAKLDEEAERAFKVMERDGEWDRTIVIYASDNGWQMPRGLANCYDSGSRVPLAIRWPERVAHGRVVDAFVNVGDLGPTILEMAGLKPTREMSMKSILPLLLDRPDTHDRKEVFLERERHANVRRGDLSYPMRAIRTEDFLCIHNLRPDRWPAGDPDVFFLHERPFGDVDTTAVKDFLLSHRTEEAFQKFDRWIFAKRPAVELYDLRSDPHQLTNVAQEARYEAVRDALLARIRNWMEETNDPRLDPAYDAWDRYPYYGKAPKASP